MAAGFLLNTGLDRSTSGANPPAVSGTNIVLGYDIDRDAPVIGRAERIARAPKASVWAALSDLERWPDWNVAVKTLRMEGPLEPGTVFRWSAGGARIISRLRVVEKGRRIAWDGKSLGIAARHVWQLSDAPEGTRIVTEESFAGFLPWLLAKSMKRTLDASLDQGLKALSDEAERQSPFLGRAD